MRPLAYLPALAGPAVALTALGSGHSLALPTASLMVGCVVLDQVLPTEPEVTEDDREHGVSVWLPRVFAPALIAFSLGAARSFAAADLTEQVVLALCAGIYACTFGINVAHELIHSRSRLDRSLGGLMCASLLAGSFKVEHVRGHHRDVATPDDPSSAPLGRSLWAHLPRAVVGNWRKGWALETRRVQKRSLPWWRHELIGWALVSTALVATAGLISGPAGAAFIVVQGILARVNLEVINYVEHYGLCRSRRASGRYEPVRPVHSWTSEHMASRVFLLNLPRHADHHAVASRPWGTLRHHPDAPALPAGYVAMFVLAMVPPLWHRVMDPRVRAHTDSAIRPATVIAREVALAG